MTHKEKNSPGRHEDAYRQGEEGRDELWVGRPFHTPEPGGSERESGPIARDPARCVEGLILRAMQNHGWK